MERLTTPPGQHGKAPTKMSTYGTQLREKQTAKRIYGILERQFRRYIERATRYRGVSGHILIQLLERRLDNVVFRIGYANTRAAARQLVGHNHIYVNGIRVNIPSYEVRPGDVITLSEKAKNNPTIKACLDYAASLGRKSWVEYNEGDMSSKFLSIPNRDDIDDVDVREQMIIELYSK